MVNISEQSAPTYLLYVLLNIIIIEPETDHQNIALNRKFKYGTAVNELTNQLQFKRDI